MKLFLRYVSGFAQQKCTFSQLTCTYPNYTIEEIVLLVDVTDA